MAIIDMQIMRYINLLDRASHVKTTKCFVYNNTIFFAVPKSMMSRAIGPNALNIREMQDKLDKRVKIIEEPSGVGDSIRFISDIVDPVRFKSVDIRDNELVITAGNTQSKASLIGRNKRRMEELNQIVKDTYNLDLKIV